MDPQNKVNSNQSSKQTLINQLLQFGFDEQYIQKAVDITLDKQKAAQIIMKLIEQGPNVDLSMYQIQVPIQPQVMPSQEAPMAEGGMVPRMNRAKMIFIVNGSLKMGKGKICAQVGHAAIGAYLQMQEMARYDEKSKMRLFSWEHSGGAKIVVRAKDLKQMLEVQTKLKKLDININTYLVEDAGHTQIQAGSKTVLGVGPAFSDQLDPITDHLKLL